MDDLQDEEVWLPVTGWEEFYEVSSHGRVRSLDRVTFGRNRSTRITRGKILSQGRGTSGYLIVVLSKYGQRKTCSVHRLVAEAFFGAAPPDYQCCHGDGNKDNNHVDNLRWDSAVGNVADAVRHGTSYNVWRTRQTHCSKGHLLEGNSFIRPDSGTLRCRTCHRENGRRSGAKSRCR